MAEPSRMIILDNKDTRQDYDDQGATPYRNSLYGTSADGANLRFSFNGNYARIMGTYDLDTSTNASDPDWECTLDGNTVQRESVDRSIGNRRRTLCAFLDLPGGDHTIGLTTKTQGRNIYIDYVEYKTIARVENEVIWASSGDPDLRYSGLWTQAGVDRYTMRRGSSATFRFIGTGVTLHAAYAAELPRANGEASYSIDGGPSTTFVIPGGDNTSMRNRRIFEVNSLSKQVHTIVLTYNSNGDITPLVISYFYIENGTNLLAPISGSDPSAGGTTVGNIPSTTAATIGVSGGTGPTPLPSGESQDHVPPPSSTKTSVGAIVGAILGSVAVLLLLLFLLWCRRHRRPRQQGEDPMVHPPGDVQQRQGDGMSTAPVTPLTNYSNIPSPTQDSAYHPATRILSRPARNAYASPYLDSPVYSESTYRSSARSRSIYHQDSGARLQASEVEPVVEHPPVYTLQ